MRMKLPRLTLMLTLLMLIWDGSEGHAGPYAQDMEEDSTIRVYKQVAPATVFIASAYVTRHQWTNGQTTGIGSGVVVDEQGLILTNTHVVEGAAKIMAILHDGTRLPAEVVGSDPVSDLALLRVALPQDHRQAVVKLGDSDRLEIGQKVLAIGHPFGLGYALTTGVVSGLGANTLGPPGAPSERVIQTSAAINPGNSGGPLVDLQGRVIGINTAILVDAQNIGFAIPINMAKTVMAELQTHGRVIRPWLGVKGKLLTDEIIDLFSLPLSKGLLIEDVEEGSPAEKAGLRPGALNVMIEGEQWVLGGDIIQAVNGHDLTVGEQYQEVIKGLAVNQNIELTVLRDGKLQNVPVTLKERPRPPATDVTAQVQGALEQRFREPRSGVLAQGRPRIGL
jgi:serine protease Do